MKNFKQYIFIASGLVLFGACKPEIETATPSKGNADFSRYIAVGNSLTAGYADNGLYREGQQNSYPSIIAEQLAAVGGGAFNQPLFTEAQANGSGYLKLTGFTAEGNPITAAETNNLAVRGSVTVPGFPATTLYTKYTGDINNYGVPGIKLANITVPIYGNLNGYFERMLPTDAPNNNSTSYLDFVTAKPFTFFTNWLGNNDALGYATSGGAGDVLTDKATFTALYNQLINRLTANGAKGAVATIPDVTTIPYFNTVTIGAILAGVQKTAPTVQGLYISARTTSTGTAAYAARVATANDMVVLTFPTSKIGTPVATAGGLPYGLTPLTPIENQYVLDNNEITLTRDYVTSYNATIKSVAAAKGLAVFDAFTFLNNLKQKGLTIDGINLSSGFISGGVFSLDGVHLTPRGYAIVANEFIKAINAQYGSTISAVNITKYRGVKFP